MRGATDLPPVEVLHPDVEAVASIVIPENRH
jgi:hypothetical protein